MKMIVLPSCDYCLKNKLLAVMVFTLIIGKVTSYEYHYVESDCKGGNLTIQMSGSGSRSSGILQATRHTSYSLLMSCKIRLVAPVGHYVLVSVREIGFRMALDGSCVDYLEIEQIMCKPMVRLDEEHHYESSEKKPPNILNLVYRTTAGLDNKTLSGFPGFIVTFTAFQKAEDLEEDCSSGGNQSERFLCKNKYCIWSGLICDGHNNCGDISDEAPAGNSKCGRSNSGSTVLIILGVLIVLLLAIMCSATLLCSKNATVRRFSNQIRRRTLSFLPARSTSK